MNISTALSSAAEVLKEADVVEPRKEAASLLVFVLQKDAAFLVAHPEFEMRAEEATKFEHYLSRRASHEPFQYIIGRQEFYGLDFDVSPDVLIPRPETEILVENAIAALSDRENPSFLEIGVGSGCISVSILHAVRTATAVGVDISQPALEIPQRNAEKHNVAERLDLMHGDVFGGVTGTFDLIVSNPPYVPHDQIDSLQPEVRDHEPRTALDGGQDGLDIVARIIREAPQFLKPQGLLFIEIGFDQAANVRAIVEPETWKRPEFLADLQGISRILKVGKKAQ